MRREFEEFNRIHPCKSSKGAENKIVILLRKKWLLLKLSYIHAGSEKWHKWQQKISLLSSANDDMEIRNFFYEQSVKKCGGKLYILPHAYICYPYKLTIGYNCFINRGVYITARDEIYIGDNVMIGPGTVINSGMHKYNDPQVLIRDQGHYKAPIKIGDDVWIGANVIIMPGVTIGSGTVIGAGAVVTKSIPPYTVAVGVPARVIKRREGE